MTPEQLYDFVNYTCSRGFYVPIENNDGLIMVFYPIKDEYNSSGGYREKTVISRSDEIAIATRVRDNVKEYLAINEQLKKLQSAVRELRKRKTNAQHQIIEDMATLNVENLKLNKGSLVAKRTTPKVSLTKTSIISIGKS